MISYLRHDAIDRGRWDESVRNSLNRRVYAFSWYLDIIAPGWDALVSDDYSSVFPLTPGRKAGVSYLFQPFFAQQLGLISSVPVDTVVADLFLSAIPARFRYIDIQVMPDFIPGIRDVKLVQRLNHELNLMKPYEEISSAYSQNARRNIRKSMESGVNTGRNITPGELVDLFRRNFGESEGKLKAVHYERMGSLMNRSLEKGIGNVRAAFGEDGLLSSAAFFLSDGNRVYFLFAASAPSARENGAMFQLIDGFIKENAVKPLILDFEGGNAPSLGRFYKSFGASEAPYYRLLWNHLPAWIYTGLKLGRALGEKIK
jgi:hypothetical protein